VLLSRPLGPVGGAAVTNLLGRAGADVRTATRLRALEGDARGAVRRAVLSDGATVWVNTVVKALGAMADTAWLRGSGLLLDDGVVCDAACCAVVDPSWLPLAVVVAGGLACRPGCLLAGRSTVVRHRSNASELAAMAVRILLAGADAEPYVHIPSVWSDLDTQAGRLRLRSVTLTAYADAVHVLDSDPATGRALIA
jgi:hypothetical protein